MPKDLTTKPRKVTPALRELTDPASLHAASAFGPDALRAAAVAEADRSAIAPIAPPSTIAPADLAHLVPVSIPPLQARENALDPVEEPVGTAAQPSSGAESDVNAPPVPMEAGTGGLHHSPASSPNTSVDRPLSKKTIYPSDPGRTYLKRFRRRHRIAETLVAEYAIERLFECETDERITKTLHALGHGLRRSRADSGARRPLTVYLGNELRDRIERLHDDHRVAEGIVGGYAIDWLASHVAEEEVVNALRQRGWGLYRTPRTAQFS
jgi:hypothetical protein